MTLDELKTKKKFTRDDLSEFLASVGAPGEKQDEKIEAVKQLELTNSQGYDIVHTLDSYEAF